MALCTYSQLAEALHVSYCNVSLFFIAFCSKNALFRQKTQGKREILLSEMEDQAQSLIDATSMWHPF